MKPLLTGLGVDYEQWKALTVAALKTDLRHQGFGGARTKRNAGGAGAVGRQLLFYTMIGAFMAPALWIMNDRFAAALIVFSYVILMVGTAMLADYSAAVISPADYTILGFQPITSRTFFAVKLTNVLVYTLSMTTAVGLLPVIVFFLKHGPAIGASAVLALYACALTVTLMVVAGYASLVRLVGARRLRHLISYVQLLAGFVFYGSYFAMAGIMSEGALASFTVPRTPQLLLYPGSWFASYLELAAGRSGAAEVLPVLASVAMLIVLTLQLRGRLSLEYAEKIGVLTSSTEAAPRASASRPGLWFRGGEARAVAILVRSHFRNDLKFRMGILAILPLTAVYLLVGLNRTGDVTAGARSSANLSMVTIAILLFPTMLKANLARSDAFRASWIFFASPTDRTRLIRSARNLLVTLFLMPYLLFVGVALAFLTDDLAYLAVYLVLTGLLSHLALLIAMLADPELPFSKPVGKSGSTVRMLGIMTLVGLFSAIVPWISRWLYHDAGVTAIVFAVVIGTSLLLNRLMRTRVERQAAYLEFQG